METEAEGEEEKEEEAEEAGEKSRDCGCKIGSEVLQMPIFYARGKSSRNTT